MKKADRHNFHKCTRKGCTTQNHPYDYNSVMHYPNKAFSVNGRVTLARKGCGANTSGQCRLGRSNGFSYWDVKGMNRLYQCSNTRTGGGTVTSGNCKDKNSNCPGWANSGYCNGEYKWFMKGNCAKSCNKCDSKLTTIYYLFP